MTIKKILKFIEIIQLIVLILIISALFYFGQYKYISPPSSTTSLIENILHITKAHKEINGIVLGDSTAANGFRTNYFNENSTNLKVVNMAIPGSWFYSLHKLQNSAKKTNDNIETVIVILGPSQFLIKTKDAINADLEYQKTNSSILDLYTLYLYSDSFKTFYNNAIPLIIRPILYERDLKDIIKNPEKRLKAIPGNISWLNRGIKESDPFWADNRDTDVCNIGPLNEVEKKYEEAIEKNDQEKIEKYSMVAKAYEIRKGEKVLKETAEKSLDTFLNSLSKKYKKIYVTNTPIFIEFNEVYPHKFLKKTENITKNIATNYENVIYIPQSNEIKIHCENFLDVVHLNIKGAENFTQYLLDQINENPIFEK